ncbi:hypothetical protein J5N97_022211 [Dioscorea zingiberensis]|uniref:chalcone synthase n=1 Tax=Dioscorea zingiberensis TaxID=325984 RepID=A0A9D5HAF0_9LILI|nr:hypothetical protein J5N97_022211 [Dioscorea zingiberensis]
MYYEIIAVTFRGPSETHHDSLIGQALFGDGAATVKIDADPDTAVERPLFQMVSTAPTILPDSDDAIDWAEVGEGFVGGHAVEEVGREAWTGEKGVLEVEGRALKGSARDRGGEVV